MIKRLLTIILLYNFSLLTINNPAIDNFENEFHLISTPLSCVHYIADIIQRNKPRVIGIFGPSCGGKTTTAQELQKILGDNLVVLISIDDYWHYTREEMKQKNITGYDWQARDKTRFLNDLEDLKNNKSIEKPLQDYIYECPSQQTEHLEPKDIIILEATLDFSEIADLTIFVYAPDDIILQRRLERDCHKKVFANSEDLANYVQQKSIPAYKEKLLPCAKNADFIFDTYENKIYKKYR